MHASGETRGNRGRSRARWLSLSRAFIRRIRAKGLIDSRIKSFHGTFAHYDGKTIIMTGGEKVAADMALLAIGFKPGVPSLSEASRNKLVEPDGKYRLYRLIANPDLPDRMFVGFGSSFCTVLTSP